MADTDDSIAKVIMRAPAAAVPVLASLAKGTVVRVAGVDVQLVLAFTESARPLCFEFG